MQSALEVFEVVGMMNFYGDEMIKVSAANY